MYRKHTHEFNIAERLKIKAKTFLTVILQKFYTLEIIIPAIRYTITMTTYQCYT